MTSAKWRPFYLRRNVFMVSSDQRPTTMHELWGTDVIYLSIFSRVASVIVRKVHRGTWVNSLATGRCTLIF